MHLVSNMGICLDVTFNTSDAPVNMTMVNSIFPSVELETGVEKKGLCKNSLD